MMLQIIPTQVQNSLVTTMLQVLQAFVNSSPVAIIVIGLLIYYFGSKIVKYSGIAIALIGVIAYFQPLKLV